MKSVWISSPLFFLGIEGSHIKPTRASPSDPLTFSIDPTLDPSLKELLNRITPLCVHYSTVVAFAEDHVQMGSGRVNQALSGAIYALLKDYYIFVAQLETQHKRGELTLNKVHMIHITTQRAINCNGRVYPVLISHFILSTVSRSGSTFSPRYRRWECCLRFA